MAWTRQNVRDKAAIYSRDPNLEGVSSTEANAILDGLYATYVRQLLRDRLRQIGTGAFVTFAANEYVANSVDSNCVEVVSLEYDADPEYGAGISPLEQDDFNAVVADSEHSLPSDSQRRYGVVRLQNAKSWRVAVFPPANGPISFIGYGHCEAVKPAGDATELDLEDADAENLSRLLAFEIMSLNGEDDSARGAVISGVAEDVRMKMGYTAERVPRAQYGKREL